MALEPTSRPVFGVLEDVTRDTVAHAAHLLDASEGCWYRRFAVAYGFKDFRVSPESPFGRLSGALVVCAVLLTVREER